MKNININKLSDILMNAGIILSVIALFLIMKSKANLPTGVCPVENYSSLIYLSITISVLGFLLSFIKRIDEKN